jgi:hypothetical protein
MKYNTFLGELQWLLWFCNSQTHTVIFNHICTMRDFRVSVKFFFVFVFFQVVRPCNVVFNLGINDTFIVRQ